MLQPKLAVGEGRANAVPVVAHDVQLWGAAGRAGATGDEHGERSVGYILL